MGGRGSIIVQTAWRHLWTDLTSFHANQNLEIHFLFHVPMIRLFPSYLKHMCLLNVVILAIYKCKSFFLSNRCWTSSCCCELFHSIKILCKELKPTVNVNKSIRIWSDILSFAFWQYLFKCWRHLLNKEKQLLMSLFITLKTQAIFLHLRQWRIWGNYNDNETKLIAKDIR